ncbi:MAG: hypothetical protein V1690_03495, partial [Candidatus Moraniibacteriota bacterium]
LDQDTGNISYIESNLGINTTVHIRNTSGSFVANVYADGYISSWADDSILLDVSAGGQTNINAARGGATSIVQIYNSDANYGANLFVSEGYISSWADDSMLLDVSTGGQTNINAYRYLANSTVYVYNSDASYGANLYVEGNIGAGDSTPSYLLTVGTADQFGVDSSGNMIKINNVAYSWPSSQGSANYALVNNGSGTLIWAAPSAGSASGSMSLITSGSTFGFETNYGATSTVNIQNISAGQVTNLYVDGVIASGPTSNALQLSSAATSYIEANYGATMTFSMRNTSASQVANLLVSGTIGSGPNSNALKLQVEGSPPYNSYIENDIGITSTFYFRNTSASQVSNIYAEGVIASGPTTNALQISSAATSYIEANYGAVTTFHMRNTSAGQVANLYASGVIASGPTTNALQLSSAATSYIENNYGLATQFQMRNTDATYKASLWVEDYIASGPTTNALNLTPAATSYIENNYGAATTFHVRNADATYKASLYVEDYIASGATSNALNLSPAATSYIEANYGAAMTFWIRNSSTSYVGNVAIGNGYLCVDNNSTCTGAATAGTVYAVGAYTTGADYAEYFSTQDTDLKSGEVVCVDTAKDNAVKRCQRSGDNDVMGVVSTKPSVVGNHIEEIQSDPSHYAIIGMIGQVPGLVSNENGTIQIGDSLTAASTPGYMRKANAGESTVGVAMQNFNETEGTIQILISRRNQSLTVEKVEEAVTQNIASMNIQDQVNKIIADSQTNLDAQMASINQFIAQLQSGAMNTQTILNSQTAEIQSSKEQISDLVLKTNANINTLEELQSSVDANLLLISGEIDKLDKKMDDNQDAVAAEFAQMQKQIDALTGAQAENSVLTARVDLLESQLELLQTIITYDPENKVAVVLGEFQIKGELEIDSLKAGAEMAGKSAIPAGEKEIEIKTLQASADYKIYITPTIKLNGRGLYVDEKNIREGENFQVKLDGEVLEKDASFNWIIVK